MMHTMRTDDGPVAAQWKSDHTDDHPTLTRARQCAALVDPTILPPENWDNDSRLPQTYQSMGSRGIMNIVGAVSFAMYPPGAPWAELIPSPAYQYNPDVPDEDKQAFAEQLFLVEMVIENLLSSNSMAAGHRSQAGQRRRRSAFRSQKLASLNQLFVTGDSLEQITDDFRIIVYNRDQYVTRRDTAGNVLYHIVREQIDPLSLSDEQFAATGLQRGELDESAHKRMTDIYTRCEWQPRDRVWKIEQEVNGNTINERTEPESPFLSTPLRLTPGRHYGEGFVSVLRGDLHALDTLNKRILDMAGLAAKQHPAIDRGSQLNWNQLVELESGQPIMGANVRGGVVQDIAMVSFTDVRDFSMVTEAANRLTAHLAQAMLIESQIQPQKERVTAAQIQRIAQELEGSLGGIYTPLVEDQHIPMLRRILYVLRRDKIIKWFNEDDIEIHSLTGLNAVARQQEFTSLVQFTQAVSSLGPEALRRINIGALVDAFQKRLNMYEPGLVKDEEDVRREANEALQQQAALEAAKQASSAAGDIAVNAAEQQIGAQ